MSLDHPDVGWQRCAIQRRMLMMRKTMDVE